MGQEVRGVPEAASLAVEPPEEREPSIGRYLAEQRRLRAISLEELAQLTRIPRRSLERLESGAYDGEVDGFARGFVRAVAEGLGLDPEATVMRLQCEPPSDAAEIAGRMRRIRGALLAATLMLVALAGVALGLWKLGELVLAPRAEPGGPERVYRRDAVRELAEQQARRSQRPAPLESAHGHHAD